jgi:hypothetical protein
MSSTPKSPATLSRTSSGTWFLLKASLSSAHATTGAAPARDTASTVTLRSRRGTNAIQAMAATPAASSAPRE